MKKETEASINKLSGQLLDFTSQPVPSGISELWKEHKTIREYLSQLSSLQNGNIKFSNRNENLPAFLKWVAESKINAQNVTVEEFENPKGEFGLKVLNDVARGDVVLSVPRKCMVTTELIERCEGFKIPAQKDPILKGMGNILMSLYILNEKLKGKDSYWNAYLNVLPSQHFTALYFTQSEMEYLKGSPGFEAALKLFRNISRQFAYFLLILAHENNILSRTKFNLNNFTFDNYKWAVSTTMTRINLIPSSTKEDQKIPAMIPLLDFANHVHCEPNMDFSEEIDGAVCKSVKDMSSGDQFFIFYGKRKNLDFLLHDGFVYNQNLTYDSLEIKLGLPKGDKCLNDKSAILSEYFGLRPNESFHIGQNGIYLPEEMIFFAEIFLADKQVIDRIVEEKNLNCIQNDTKLQLKTLSFLKTRLELLLRGYLLKKEKIVPSETNKNLQLISDLVEIEKEYLRRAISDCESMEKSLTLA